MTISRVIANESYVELKVNECIIYVSINILIFEYHWFHIENVQIINIHIYIYIIINFYRRFMIIFPFYKFAGYFVLI